MSLAILAHGQGGACLSVRANNTAPVIKFFEAAGKPWQSILIRSFTAR
jgi:hypothetical protein